MSNNNIVERPSYLATTIQNLGREYSEFVCYILKILTHCFQWWYGIENFSSPTGQPVLQCTVGSLTSSFSCPQLAGYC